MVTLDQFKKLNPLCPKEKLQDYLDGLNSTLKEFEINTHLRISHFIAQIWHESLRLKYFKELASGESYTKRKDLGNLEPEAILAASKHGMKTGPFYKGHGPIQITGFYNHKKCGEFLGIDLVNNPELLCTPQQGFRGAGWFWYINNLNKLADKDDIKKITKIINGGYNHLNERILMLNKVKQVLCLVK